MGDEKLRQELFYMVKLSTKYDFKDMTVVEEILRQENQRKILTSVFGTRFKARIFDIAAGVDSDDSCVICGKKAENHCICQECIDSILDSDYAKNQIKNKQKNKLDFRNFIKNFKIKLPSRSSSSKSLFKNINGKRVALGFLIFCLSFILIVQIWLLVMWLNIPDYNPIESPKVSEHSAELVTDQNSAFEQLSMDFPIDMGYSINYVRQDYEYVGRFLLEKGDCCEEIEDTLTKEEMYDYFFTEPVYVFTITNISDYSAKVGLAEVSENGSILVMGSFNDGRRTDCHYKIR